MSVVDILPVLFENYFIKVIFLIHAFLAPLGALAIPSEYKQVVYIFYNSLFLFALLLAILVDKNNDIILISCLLNVLGLALDVIVLISCANCGYGFFGLLVLMLHLICRPVSSILLLKNYSARAGIDDPTSGLLEVHVAPAPQARSAYQNIDEPNQPLP